MSNSIAKLAILLTADASGVSRGVAQAQQSIQGLGSQIATFAASIGALAGAGAAISWGVKLAAEAETAKAGFEVMLGSGEKAAAMLKDIKQFAAATPFGGADLRDAAKTMLAFGVSAESIMPSLKMLGDVAGGNSQRLSSLALVFGQISSAGKLTGGDLLQLINTGFNPLQEMAGGSAEKYKILRSEMEKGNITFNMVRESFQRATSEGGQFNGMMEKMSQTVEGRWSTLKDQFAELALAIGEKLLPVASRMIDMTSKVLSALQGLSATTVENTAKLVAFAAAFGTALVVIPKIVTAIRSLIAMYRTLTIAQSIQQALSGPKGWLTLAASLAVAAGAAYTVGQMFDKSNAAIAKTTKEATKAAQAVKGFDFDSLGGGKNKASDDAAKAMEALHKQGESLAQSLRTPFEKIADDLRAAQSLLAAGAISAETYARAQAKAGEELRGQLRSAEQIRDSLRQQQGGPVAALQFGTQAAISAISNSQREQKLQIDVERAILAENRKANELLTKILREKPETVKVTEVNL
jgi:hypothetical protein